MQSSYTATYYLPGGNTYPATIFISPVTLTIRYTDANGQQQDVYWIEKELKGFEEKPGGTELRYTGKSGETEKLIITDTALVQAIKKQWRHNRLIGKPHQRVMSKVWTKLIVVLGILAALILIAYIWFVPWLGERVAMNFSKDLEISMGEQMYKATISNFKIDERKTEMVNRFYKQLNFNVDYPIKITVVESAGVNAFAMPGGYLVVYDAILEKMKTPEELAAMLGHEASHVELKHVLRGIFRRLARKMFLALVFGNDGGIVNVVVDNADEMKNLEYSRDSETEADTYGLKLMAKSGLDMEGMIRLMELLDRESTGVKINSLLRTHPEIADRIKNIKKQIPLIDPVKRDNPELKKIFHEIYEQW
jgi:beta-barrel assembly-enhancing protease